MQIGRLRIALSQGTGHRTLIALNLVAISEPTRELVLKLLNLLEFYLAAVDLESVTKAVACLEASVHSTEHDVAHPAWRRIIPSLKMELNQRCFEQSMATDLLVPHIVWPSHPPPAFQEYVRQAAAARDEQRRAWKRVNQVEPMETDASKVRSQIFTDDQRTRALD